ncbi:hypothetical protein SDC9_117965 [bioreactor metagenome]|uniref:Uncharacterized protein n=1 Tax=bioreactor metagenome TaxID=1076179 RepID=A0A645C076_9ZZZZ
MRPGGHGVGIVRVGQAMVGQTHPAERDQPAEGHGQQDAADQHPVGDREPEVDARAEDLPGVVLREFGVKQVGGDEGVPDHRDGGHDRFDLQTAVGLPGHRGDRARPAEEQDGAEAEQAAGDQEAQAAAFAPTVGAEHGGDQHRGPQFGRRSDGHGSP